MTTAQAKALFRGRSGVILDLGCGASKHPQSIGVDVRPLKDVDVVCDLFAFPWHPLPDNVAHTVILSHVWEHVPPHLTLKFMAELHRVCQQEAHVFISGPFALGPRYVQDPTHCNPTNEATFAYWDPEHPSGLWEVYRPPPFTLKHWEVVPAGADRDFNAVLICRKDAPPDHVISKR